ncbi:MAG TPA: Do family serine endopeptidase, partial [Steroidobacteraceae bacterium]|nr:Do family serine endopeptidase [Steroidobacteraceae bacterium]
MPAVVGEMQVPSLSPMIKKVSPAVVNIATRGTIHEKGPQNPLLDDPFFRRFFDVPPDSGPRDRPFQSAGSGVIFDAKTGYIVTNAHVVENASEITVTLQDGRDLKAEIVGSDEPSDVAVLKVKPDGLTQIALGDSSKVEVGDFAVAIGNPFGLAHTVTSGIISGLSRSGINPDGYEDFIQTDASINPGNSGGALVNLRGELIGINTAILSRSGGNIGIGFAIPVNMARGIMDQLLKYGSVKRGLLGVNIYSLTPDMAKSLNLPNTQGVLVSQVNEGSAAEKAGIKAGDVITSINGQTIKSNSELRNAVGLSRVGEKLDVALIRDRKPMHVIAVITELPAPSTNNTGKGGKGGDTASIHPGLAGATLADAPSAGGVTVKAIEPRSAADQARLRTGDRIESVNSKSVA